MEERLLARGHAPVVSFGEIEALDQLREHGADMVLVLLPLEGRDGTRVLAQLREVDQGIPIVVCGSDATIPNAARAMALGASEHFAEPLPATNDLLASIGVLLGARRHDTHLRYLRRKDAADGGANALIGESAGMRRVRAMVDQICSHVSATPTSILISGETGTGKGLVAKALHYGGARRNAAFVDINCAALPAPMIEAELFGHERGAFTDAKRAREGLFETADRGSIFLDEIGSMSLDLQSRLLKVIEDQQFRRIGSSTPIAVDVQIVAATHEHIPSLVEQSRFRADLYHRLNVVHIEMPPLRERGEDRLLLARSFIRSTCKRYGLPERELADDAAAALMRYPFPGNVRELRNIIERVILLENTDTIDREHLQLRLSGVVEVGNTDAPACESDERLDVRLPSGSFSLDELERATLRAALERNHGNVSRTARYLQISRQKLLYRLRKHGLRR